MSAVAVAVPRQQTDDMPRGLPSEASPYPDIKDVRKERTTETSYGETVGTKPVRHLAASGNGSQSLGEPVDQPSLVIVLGAGEQVAEALPARTGRAPKQPRPLLSRPLKVRPQARAFLTSRVKQLVGPLVAIARTKALRGAIEITSMELGVFVDPEDDSRELVLEIHTAALPRQGLAYWDTLGTAVNDWRGKLPSALAEILAERLAVHVTWVRTERDAF